MLATKTNIRAKFSVEEIKERIEQYFKWNTEKNVNVKF